MPSQPLRNSLSVEWWWWWWCTGCCHIHPAGKGAQRRHFDLGHTRGNVHSELKSIAASGFCLFEGLPAKVLQFVRLLLFLYLFILYLFVYLFFWVVVVVFSFAFWLLLCGSPQAHFRVVGMLTVYV